MIKANQTGSKKHALWEKRLARLGLACAVGWVACGEKLCAQLPIGSWRSYATYGRVDQVVRIGGVLLARSPYGLLRVEVSSQNSQSVTAVDGLHTAEITALGVAGRRFLVGYIDGQVDVFSDDKREIIGLDDLQKSSFSLSKEIYTFHATPRRIYVGGTFGMLLFGTENLSLLNTYTELGTLGESTSVKQIAVLGDTLFLASSEGFIHGYHQDEDALLDPASWKRPPSGRGAKQAVAVFQGSVYGLSTGAEETSLLRYREGVWEEVFSLDVPLTWLRTLAQGLLMGSRGADLYVYRGANAEGATRQPLPADLLQLRDALWVDEALYVCDAAQGLVLVSAGNTSRSLGARIPAPASPMGLRARGSSVYAFASATALSVMTSGQSHRLFSWQGHRGWAEEEGAPHNVVDVLEQPSMHQGVVVASYTKGVFLKSAEGYQSLGTPPEALGGEEAKPALSIAAASNSRLVVGLQRGGVLAYDLQARQWERIVSVSNTAAAGMFSHLLPDQFAALIWGIRLVEGRPELVAFSTGEAGNMQRMRFPFPISRIHALALGASQRLWIATNRGLFYIPSAGRVLSDPNLSTTTPQRFRVQGQVALEEEVIMDMLLDGAGRLWCVSLDKVFVIDPSKDFLEERFLPTNSPLIRDLSLNSLALTSEGTFFFGSQAGIHAYQSRSSIPTRDYQAVKIFPNPVSADFVGEVAIRGLRPASQVRITTLSGLLVRALIVRGGTAVWDVRDARGARVPQGVYMVHVLDEDDLSEHFAGKIAVLR